jgi:hypothetical protein
MRLALILPVALLLVALVTAPAEAGVRVALSEQSARMFDDPNWQSLKLKRVRYIVPWDYAKHADQANEVGTFMNAARVASQDVLVTFSARRGCFVNNRYSRSSACRAPSASAYRSAVRGFRGSYPLAKTFAPWNEVNHVSQPTFRKPSLAVRYYNALRGACKGCKVMAADVLDSSDVASYLRGFLRASHGRGRIWGLHNYKDVNRRQSRGLTTVLRTVPGEVWLTETGGIVKFGSDFPRSESRAAARTRYMFQLAGRYDTRRRGLRARLTRLYVYRFYGEPSDSRFDAGLVNENGSLRSSYSQFKKYAAHLPK